MSDRTVFMFPGQGSQYVGMRRGTAADDELWRSAEEFLDLPLRKLVDEGPPEELTRTANAQPALLVAGVAAARAMEALGYSADIVLGHSLGEYAALVHAKVLDFNDALRLVRTRGLLMERASELAPGGMVAVIGARQDALRPVVEAVAEENGVLEITNINAPKQLVLSGEDRALDAVTARIQEERLGRAIRLDVSAAFHSSLMAPAAAMFSETLHGVPFDAPALCFIDNVTGTPESSPEHIREKLVRQLSHPVLWSASVETAWAEGGRTFVECGPKTVLGGLVKRSIRGAELIFSERL